VREDSLGLPRGMHTIAATRRQPRAIRRPGYTQHPTCMALQHEQFAPAGSILQVPPLCSGAVFRSFRDPSAGLRAAFGSLPRPQGAARFVRDRV
jgi:hypothetical protein